MPPEIIHEAVQKIQQGYTLEQVMAEFRAAGHTEDFLAGLENKIVNALNSTSATPVAEGGLAAAPLQVTTSFWLKILAVNIFFVVVAVAGYFYFSTRDSKEESVSLVATKSAFCSIESTPEVSALFAEAAPLEVEQKRLKAEYEAMVNSKDLGKDFQDILLKKEKEHLAVQDSLKNIYLKLYKAELALFPDNYYQIIYDKYCTVTPTAAMYGELRGQKSETARVSGVPMSELLCKLENTVDKIDLSNYLYTLGGNIAYAGDAVGINLINCAAQIYLNPDAILAMAKINFSGAKVLFPALTGVGSTETDHKKAFYFAAMLTILLGNNPEMMDDQSDSLWNLTAMIDDLTNSGLTYTEIVKISNQLDVYFVERGVLDKPSMTTEIIEPEYYVHSTSIDSTRVEFELYYNNNQYSYEGGCSALKFDKYTKEPAYQDCLDGRDFYIMTANTIDGLWCIDSEGNKISYLGGDLYSGLNCKGEEFLSWEVGSESIDEGNSNDANLKQMVTNSIGGIELRAAEAGTFSTACAGLSWNPDLRCAANDAGYMLEVELSDGYFCTDSNFNSGVWPTPSPYEFACSY